jgi:hypothetical protein
VAGIKEAMARGAIGFDAVKCKRRREDPSVKRPDWLAASERNSGSW